VLQPAEPVRRWKVGEVTVTKISEGVLEGGLDAASDQEGFLAQGTREALLGIEWLRPDFTFPNARYLLGRLEFEHCKRQMSEVDHGRSFHPCVFLDDSITPIIDAGLVDLVEPDHRICDEVRLIPTFGHTPGHVSVVIESVGVEALITGDTIHHPSQLTHPDWFIRADYDVERAIATRQELLERTADTGRLVIGTHWAGRSSGRISWADGAYRLDRE
jgi:glyoxylase-like metal-dependent hydrolase (beta-lactamase superfamily II)